MREVLTASEVNPNTFQRVSDATGTVVTPANVMDAATLPLTKYGLDNLDSWKGIAVSVGAFGEDLVNGPVSRITGTSSPMGAGIDAFTDKLKLAYAAHKINQMNLAPKKLLGAVVARNGINSLLTTADVMLHDQPKLQSSKLGKYTIFLEQIGIGAHVIATRLEKDGRRGSETLHKAGDFIGWPGVALGAVATAGYFKKFFS